MVPTTAIYEPRADEFVEKALVSIVPSTAIYEPTAIFTTEELFNHQKRSDTYSLFAEACGKGTRFYRPLTRAKRPLIDSNASTSIDNRPKPPSKVSEKS